MTWVWGEASPSDSQIRADSQQQARSSEQTSIHLCGDSWTTHFSTLFLLGDLGNKDGSQLTKVCFKGKGKKNCNGMRRLAKIKNKQTNLVCQGSAH